MNLLSSAALASLVFATVGCSNEVKRDAENAVAHTENVVDNAMASTGNAVQNVGQAVMATPIAQEFVDRAAKSDAFEIAAAKLAATNAQAPEVKAFAKMMIDAHTASTAKVGAAAAAAKPSIKPDATLTADQKEDLAELQALKGLKFDEEYIDGQVDAHEDALALMRKYAADGEATSLKTAASEIAPVVEKHLAEAKKLDSD
jgi:putative membrane protein